MLEGDEEGSADGDDERPLVRRAERLGALLKLGWLEGDGEGWTDGKDDGPELGSNETLGKELGEVEGPADG